MKIINVNDKSFQTYGRVLPLDVDGFVETIKARPAVMYFCSRIMTKELIRCE